MQKQSSSLRKLYRCVYALHYHLVICTKYRHRCLSAAMLETMREIAVQRCTGWGGTLQEFNGEADHIHMLLQLPPNLDLSRFVNNLKTTTSRLLRRDYGDRLKTFYRKPVLWSRSYCIVSCGGASLSVIKRYIEQQKTPD